MAKLRPILILAGVAGGAIAVVRKRGSGDQIQQAASAVADKAPDSVKQAASQAASQASDLAERAKDAAPDQVKDAVEKATGGSSSGNGADETAESPRYAAPAEAGSQPPATESGAPSSDPQATVARTVASDPAESLHTKPHDLPADVVMPDVSNDDPAVREAEAAAAADAGSIGGNVDRLATDEPGFPEDPERRPVIEGSGDPDEQTTEEEDRELGGNRETRP